VVLPERPVMELWTEAEFVQTPLSFHKKVLNVLAEWEGWANKVDNLPCVKRAGEK
jgi:hypothetical protein